jgi:hypothetical protein
MTRLPYPQGELCLTRCQTGVNATVTRLSRLADRSATSSPVMSAFARRGGAGDRLLIPTLDEWAAWKAAVA